jgi:hypothetical protein
MASLGVKKELATENAENREKTSAFCSFSQSWLRPCVIVDCIDAEQPERDYAKNSNG